MWKQSSPQKREKIQMNKEKITAQYEQEALSKFRAWYQAQETPTIQQASQAATLIARESVRCLTALKVIYLLIEYPEWVYEQTTEICACRGSISTIIQKLLIDHLEKKIQKDGLALKASNEENNTAK
jgi:hypothetical protein